MKKSLLYTALGIVGLAAGGVALTQPFFQYRTQRQVIASALKDPDSAKFKDERVSTTGSYCAEVNSKNGFGAYGGFKKIISETACTAFFDDGSYHVHTSSTRSTTASNCEMWATVANLNLASEALEAVNAARTADLTAKVSRSITIPTETEVRRHIFQRWWVEKCSQ